jgi:hypothetical protein
MGIVRREATRATPAGRLEAMGWDYAKRFADAERELKYLRAWKAWAGARMEVLAEESWPARRAFDAANPEPKEPTP